MSETIEVANTRKAIRIFTDLKLIPKFVGWYDLPFVFTDLSREKSILLIGELNSQKIAYRKI